MKGTFGIFATLVFVGAMGSAAMGSTTMILIKASSPTSTTI